MSIEEIRTLRNRRPFQAFTIVMDDGRAVEVEQPERIALAPTGTEVSVFEGTKLSFLEIGRMRILGSGSSKSAAA